MHNHGSVHHALAVPASGQGHITPFMRFCSLLASHHGFCITFVKTDDIFKYLSQQPTTTKQTTSDSPDGTVKDKSEDGSHDINEKFGSGSIRQVRLHFDDNEVWSLISGSSDSIFQQLDDVVSHCLPPALERLVRRLNASDKDPPVTCLISDFVITAATTKLAETFGLPRIVLFTCCQTFNLWCYYLFNGDIPVDKVLEIVINYKKQQSLWGMFEKQLEGIPSLRYRDLPHLRHKGHDNTEYLYRDLLIPQGREAFNFKAHAIVVNSVEDLEPQAFTAMRNCLPKSIPVLPVGPLLDMDSRITPSAAKSLFNEDVSCLDWLDKQPNGSVLYIAFGSISCLSAAQLQEFVAGILASQQCFMWVFRPDIVDNSVVVNGVDVELSGLTPESILQQAGEGKGYMVSWAPQLRVLAHPAVGAFLTHCGWNSVVEALANGVPMLCWPYFADQLLDARLIVEDWQVGLSFDDHVVATAATGNVDVALQDSNGRFLVSRNDIKNRIVEIMRGAQGEKLRHNAAHIKEIFASNLSLAGKSHHNIHRLVESLRI